MAQVPPLSRHPRARGDPSAGPRSGVKKMDSCLRRNDGRGAWGGIPACAGMTVRGRNDGAPRELRLFCRHPREACPRPDRGGGGPWVQCQDSASLRDRRRAQKRPSGINRACSSSGWVCSAWPGLRESIVGRLSGLGGFCLGRTDVVRGQVVPGRFVRRVPTTSCFG